MIKVLVIAGQTASGKTSLSLEWAQTFKGEIINADSQQVYRGLDIGTAKIKPEETQGVPHHLMDIRSIDQGFSVKDFQTLARAHIQAIHQRGQLPILVGGTGFYLKAALYDYVFDESNQVIDAYEQETTETLYQRLMGIDPKAASAIHVNNRKRIVRALNIAEGGTLKSDIIDQQAHQPIYDVFWVVLTLPKELLDERIQERVLTMASMGLKDEVLHHFKDEQARTFPSFQAIGYKEWLPYLEGKQTEAEVLERIVIATRQFAKRQMTWFRHQFPSRFVDMSDPQDIKQCFKEIQAWMKENT